MHPSPRPRKGVSDSLHRQLNMYTLAATAAGYALLVSPPAAEARVVYTPTHIVLNGGPLPIDLNRDGVVDFVLLDEFRHTGVNTNSFHLYANPAHKSNGVEGKSFRSAGVLNYGSQIGSQNTFSGRFMASFCSFDHTSTICLGGKWLSVTDKYLGLKFAIEGKIHYAWARLTVNYRLDTGITTTLTGYAYETVPGKAIVAGAKGPADAEPVSSLNTPTHSSATLGTLALGASGLAIWKRGESPTALDETNR